MTTASTANHVRPITLGDAAFDPPIAAPDGDDPALFDARVLTLLFTAARAGGYKQELWQASATIGADGLRHAPGGLYGMVPDRQSGGVPAPLLQLELDGDRSAVRVALPESVA